jgi:tRNA pseudouridine55 synthase
VNPEFNGIILIDKPAGISSFGVVGRVRWQLTQLTGKKVKVGHTGTLDPFATGLMILVVGKACKEASRFSKLDKVYEATLKLGETSSTGDPEGEIAHVSDRVPTREEVEAALGRFRGEIQQTPPIFSAIKINGVRAYKLARANKDVVIPSRAVNIYSLDLMSYEYPYVKIRTHVSSGTYIRSLASDIGLALETGAYTTELRRTRIAEYDIKDAKMIENFDPVYIIAID